MASVLSYKRVTASKDSQRRFSFRITTVSCQACPKFGFVLDCLVKKDFAPAEKTLGNLRDTFEKIREEAIRLDQSGTIPSLSQSHAVEVTV